MPEDLSQTIARVIAKAPEWAKHELTAKDAAHRERAEEALAAIITAAVQEAQSAQLAD